MQDCKPMSTPISTSLKLGKDESMEKEYESLYRSLIGSLLYLIATRPDILFAISLLSRFLHSPRETLFTTAKRVLKYIKGTRTFGMFFPSFEGESLKLVGYYDSNWGGCIEDPKSTSNYLFSLA